MYLFKRLLCFTFIITHLNLILSFLVLFFAETSVLQAATKHQIPRKTLEYYVKGKATHDSYIKMGLPKPQDVQQQLSASDQQNLVETV